MSRRWPIAQPGDGTYSSNPFISRPESCLSAGCGGLTRAQTLAQNLTNLARNGRFESITLPSRESDANSLFGGLSSISVGGAVLGIRLAVQDGAHLDFGGPSPPRAWFNARLIPLLSAIEGTPMRVVRQTSAAR